MKRYFLLSLFLPAVIFGMRERAYSIEDKRMLRLCVKELYPDVQKDDAIKKLTQQKQVEWERGFQNALERDDIIKLRPLVEVGFFTLREEYLEYAYRHKKMQVMRYLLSLKLQDYEKKSLAQKAKTNFLAFLTSGPRGGEENAAFNLFLSTFEHYFWQMRHVRNYQAENIKNQIEEYNANVLLRYIRDEQLIYDQDYLARCYEYMQNYFRRAPARQQEYIIMCAQMFEHYGLLKRLTFLKFVSDILHDTKLADLFVYTQQ